MRSFSTCCFRLCFIVSFGFPAAQAAVWDNGAGDNNWMSDLNWDTNLVPNGEPATVINGTAIIMSQSFPTVPPVTALEVGKLADLGTMIIEGASANASIEVLQSTVVSSQGFLELTTSGPNTATLLTPFVSNAGDVLIGSGGIIDSFGGPYLQSDGRTELAGGTIDATFSHIMDGVLSGEGDIVGNLLIGGLPALAEPELSPGDGIGQLNVSGDLELRANAELKIEIDGTGLNTVADLVSVDGMATLGGTLNLDLVAGSIPIGEQVSILVADSFASNFSFSDITGFETNNGSLIVVLDSTQATPVICVYESTEPGDMNGDSVVNNLDARLFAWAIRDQESYDDVFYDSLASVPCDDGTKLCGAAHRIMADLDGDRRWTFLDVRDFLEKVEESEGSAAAAWNEISSILNGPPVPEPTTAGLLVSVLIISCTGYRQRDRVPRTFG